MIMKKIIKIVLVIFTAVIFTVPAQSDEFVYTPDEVGSHAAVEKWEDLTDSLPEEIQGEVENMTPDKPDEAYSQLKESAKAEYWIDKITDAVKSALPSTLTSAVPILAVILLNAAASFILPESPRLTEAFSTTVKLSAAIILFSLTSGVIKKASAYLENLCGVMNLLLPVMEAVTLAGGNITESGVHSASVTLGVTIIGNFNTFVLTPLTSAMFSLSAVSMTAGDSGMGSAVAMFRRFVNRLWQICTIFFSSLLGFQTVLAKGADNLAIKGAKFAIGSFIPVAGGILSEAYTTVREGLSFIRGVCGVGGILILALMTVPTVIPVLMYKITLSLTKTAAELLKCPSTAAFLGECAGIVDFLLGIMLSVDLMFFLSVILFAKSW